MFDFAVGQSASLARVFQRHEIADFVALSGDRDPGPIVPNGLVGGLFSQLLGTRLPGRGTNWMKQTLRFRTPAHAGDRLTATVQIVRLRPEKRLVNLHVVCVSSSGALICEGEALVLALEMARG
jgi:acyl dehydratase